MKQKSSDSNHIKVNIQHHQTAHCESGATTNLLKFEGIHITEPLSFGIGSGIFFMHVPFLKEGGIPQTTYRIWPGYIFKRTMKLLNIDYTITSFKNADEGMAALDAVLAMGKPVGCITNIFYLDYVPEVMRFHLNVHNLIVYGKEGDEYLISDPVLPEITRVSAASLKRARFSKGLLAPNGKMYYIKSIANFNNDYKNAIIKGIKKTTFLMLHSYIPWPGINGIKTLSKQIKQYPHKLSDRKAKLYIGHIIRMQEEIGTGGAGFRFLYAAFLKEAAVILQMPELDEHSRRFTEIGDLWRDFAFNAAQLFKARASSHVTYDMISEQLLNIYHLELAVFRKLEKIQWPK